MTSWSGCSTRSTETYRRTHPGLLDSDNPGADATKLAVSGALGLRIDYYVLVNLAGFRQLVDALGGIKVNVNYPVPKGGQADAGLVPEGWIEPGPNQHLDGFDALWFARSRYGADDYQRMDRQRCVIKAIIDQADPVSLLVRYEALARSTKDIVLTDIPSALLPSFVDLSLLVQKASNVNEHRVHRRRDRLEQSRLSADPDPGTQGAGRELGGSKGSVDRQVSGRRLRLQTSQRRAFAVGSRSRKAEHVGYPGTSSRSGCYMSAIDICCLGDIATEPTFLILTALTGAPLHGYGIIREVATLSTGRMNWAEPAYRPGGGEPPLSRHAVSTGATRSRTVVAWAAPCAVACGLFVAAIAARAAWQTAAPLPSRTDAAATFQDLLPGPRSRRPCFPGLCTVHIVPWPACPCGT